MSARLIGYLANESVESKVTCLEWKQFYPLKVNPTIPNVLVIAGFDPENKLKFFYRLFTLSWTRKMTKKKTKKVFKKAS